MRTLESASDSRWTSTRAVLAVACILLLTTSIAGCSQKDSGGSAPSAWSRVGIGTADEQVLAGAATTFVATRATQGAAAARQALVDSLNHNYPGVTHAELGRDGTTIALRFSDGRMGAINTNPRMSPAETYDPTTMRQAFESGSPRAARRAARFALRGAGGQRSPNPAVTAARWGLSGAHSPTAFTRFAPHARKVLLLSASGGSYMADDDTALFDYMKAYLVSECGWAAADVDVKANKIADSYGTLDFEDFFRLKDYGLIVIVARSLDWDVPSDPNDWNSPRVAHYWVQVGDANGYNWRHDPAHGGGGAERIDVQAEITRGRIVEASETPLEGGTPFNFYMRDDLWQEQMNGNLPGSVVVLLSPHGYAARELFGLRQASSFASWTDSLDTQTALDAAWLPLFMAQHDEPDLGAILNSALPQTCGASSFEIWPGNPSLVYLPTWADVSTSRSPSGTQTVRVSATYVSSEVMSPDRTPIEDVPSAVKNFTGMVPNQPLRFLAQALNASGSVLAEAHVDTVLRTGNNDVALAFAAQPSGLTLAVSALTVDTRSVSDVTLTAAVRDEQGHPIAGRQVRFSRVPALGSIVGTNPATTDASGNASVTIHSDVLPPQGTLTVNMIALDLTSSKADTVAVRYCDNGKYIVWLAGTADEEQFWQVPGGDFFVSGVDLRRSINGDGPYGTGSWSGPSTQSFPLPGYYSDGDVIKFHVRPRALGVAGSIGPLYIHVYNCFTHHVNSIGTVAAPTSGENTFTITVP